MVKNHQMVDHNYLDFPERRMKNSLTSLFFILLIAKAVIAAPKEFHDGKAEEMADKTPDERADETADETAGFFAEEVGADKPLGEARSEETGANKYFVAEGSTKAGADKPPGYARFAEAGDDKPPNEVRLAEAGADKPPGEVRSAEAGTDQSLTNSRLAEAGAVEPLVGADILPGKTKTAEGGTLAEDRRMGKSTLSETEGMEAVKRMEEDAEGDSMAGRFFNAWSNFRQRSFSFLASLLKGQSHKIFCTRFFSIISSSWSH